MRNVDSISNHHQNKLDSQTTTDASLQPFPKSMLPGSEPINSEQSSASSSQPQSQTSPHPLGIPNPTVIRPLIRRFSPPFKPFGSKDCETDEDSIVSIDPPLIMPPVLASDLASNQFQNHSNSDVIVLSASQPRPLTIARRALFASSDTSTFSWVGLEQPPEPLPSSSTITATSPRLRNTRRVCSNSLASPANLAGSGSSASGEDVEIRALKPSDEILVDNKPRKKLKTKSGATSFHPKRPKPPNSPACIPNAPDTSASASNAPKNDKNDPQIKRRIATLLPATEPDESGQYESSTCHQCRVKTTRPKMICDQSQDPNCVVRVCHTCLMVRTVYDDIPELRAPIFQFVPGGTMLCVKCRDICPCASCRRRRGEKEHSRRGLGSNLKGFYGLTPEEREQALARKKQKQDAARQKKESRPPVEKKTPSAFRREVTSIRGVYDDDEHERLQHWAPLPVFPPLPKRRKKKRKRLEIMESVRLESQASDTNSDSSCSDTDSYEETDSDSRSLSSESSYHSNARAHVVLGPASFQLPLSSNTRSAVPLLTKRWRSNFSRSIKGDQPNFPNRSYQAAGRKSQGDKAPVVWIKSGAMVQARKPPTTEFMQRLAEEQNGRPNSDSNALDNAGSNTLPLAVGPENMPLDVLNPTHSSPQDRTTKPQPNPSTTISLTNYNIDGSNFQSSSSSSKYPLPLAHLDDNHSKAACTCTLEQLDPSIEGLENPLAPHSEKCALFGSTSYSKPTQISDSLGICSDSSLSLMVEAGLTGRQAEFAMQIDGMKAFEGLGNNPESLLSLRTNERLQFDQSSSSAVDHQAYLAGLTDEQLTAVLKEGHYVMAKQGFLPSPISPDGLPIKFNHGSDSIAHHQFTTGISPELISASLPFAISKKEVSAGERRGEGESSGRLPTELTEEDQEAGLIEAANWAAVWGVADGAGGFMITKSISLDPNKQQEDNDSEGNRETFQTDNSSNQAVKNPDHSTTRMATIPNVTRPSTEHSSSRSGTDSEWVNHACGADKELFLRAMKSRVGDEWLTDVMPLDSC